MLNGWYLPKLEGLEVKHINLIATFNISILLSELQVGYPDTYF